MTALLGALGLVIGVLLGLLGSGGSILAVPALVYVAGLPLSAAIPTSLVVVGAASATAVAPRLRQVQWRLAAVMGAAGAAAAYGGAAVNQLLPETAVLLGFAVVMAAAGTRMLRSNDETTGGSCALPGGGVDWRHCLVRSTGAGVVVGFLTGLFGVGGGFLLIPALTLLLGLPMAAAVPTSLVVVLVNAAVGFSAHAGHGAVEWADAAVFTAAAVVGSLAAARLARRIHGPRLRQAFAVLVLLVAAAVAVTTLLDLTTGP
ncbi:sulfite exporter TauE/SafE family protein [uncultured Pseudokineococcus sp.]|uniref:sulfite exporter TauE/SafE family protein n=1 Tax=uncultured Pseudokineococcus sp. TaxID=1642928 RepID=UPI00262ACFA3|nr:sulfite exporter TauE/SafE family protein [uncultured Pseudokineococcus sp.]